MKTTICHFFILFIITIVSTFSYGQKSVLELNLEPGQYAVGFKTVSQYDYSRSFSKHDAEGNLVNESGARPIQTSIWYPAEKQEESTMLFEEYTYLVANETHFPGRNDDTFEYGKKGLKTFTNSSDERFENELRVQTNAIKEAKAVEGLFPVIVYAPSLNSQSFENSVLCEFIASQGYIVVSSPCMGMNSRGMTVDIVGLETQALDIGFLISFMHTFPNADITNIAVMGFSWGGFSNVFAKMHNDNIKALISLDGSVRYSPKLFRDSHFGDISKINVPFLYLASYNYTLEELNNSWTDGSIISDNIYNALKFSDAYMIVFNRMSHLNFASSFIKLGKRDPKIENHQQIINKNYETVNSYVLNFLNAYLKKDNKAIDFMKNSPEQNGIEPYWLSKKFKEAEEKPPTLNEFARILNKNDFNNVILTYEEITKRIPEFSLKEGEVNTWGYQLIAMKKYKKAVEVFKLNTKLYNESANAWDSLGDGYKAKGDKELAIKSYKKAVEINPSNSSSKRKMKELME